MDTILQSSSQDSISFILCPICKTIIPNITFLYTNKGISVKIQCSCLENNIQMSLKSFIESCSIKSNSTHRCITKKHNSVFEQMFCIDCSCWLNNESLTSHNASYPIHLLLSNKVNVKCCFHKKNYSLYCKQCNMDICIDCKTEHKKHPIKQFTTFSLNIEEIKQQMNNLDLILEKNLQLKENINNSLQQHKNGGIDNNNKDQITQWSNDIELSFQQNQTNNTLLKQFMQLLLYTATVFELYPTYSLIQLITLMKFQDPNITLLEDTLENQCRSLIDYFSNNYAFILQPRESFIEKRKRLTQKYDCIYSTLFPFGKSHYSRDFLLLQSNDKEIKVICPTTNYSFNLQTLDFTLLICRDRPPSLFENNQLSICYTLYFGIMITDKNTNQTIDFLYLNPHDTSIFIKSHDIIKILKLTDGSLAIATYDKIYIEDTTLFPWNCKCIFKINRLKDMIQLIDGNIATISDRGNKEQIQIQIWSIQTYQCITRCHFNLNNLDVYGAEGKIIQLIDGSLATSWNTTIHLWTLKLFKCYAFFRAHDVCISTLMQLSDGTLFTSFKDYIIKLWKLY